MRVRRDGDVFRYGGLTRKVKKLFSDRKMPQTVRTKLPIFEDDSGIAWIPGFPCRDGLKPSGDGDILEIFCFAKSDFDKYKNITVM